MNGRGLEEPFHYGLLWLRLLMGAGIASHGYGKLFGGSIDMFAQGVAEMGFPLPHLSAYLAAGSEFFGGIFIALGFATRPAALAVFGTMAVAAFIKHALDVFAVKELALAYLTMAGTLIFTGGGRISIDAIIYRNWLNRRRAAIANVTPSQN